MCRENRRPLARPRSPNSVGDVQCQGAVFVRGAAGHLAARVLDTNGDRALGSILHQVESKKIIKGVVLQSKIKGVVLQSEIQIPNSKINYG